MKISASGEYAVRLMVDIASQSGYVSLKEVAERQDISLKYAEKIVSKLLKSGLLESQRGQDGGYKLTKKPQDYTVREILEVTGDCTSIVSCLETDCPKKSNCTSVSVWERLNGLINNFLDKITIFDLIDKKNI